LATLDLVPARHLSGDGRRHFRVEVALLGRYMLENREEHACQSLDFSPGGVSLLAPVRGAVGERVIMYFEHLGRLEGEVARHTPQGFAVELSGTTRKRDKLASQLTWLANRQALGLPEDRRHERVVPRNPITELRVEQRPPVPARLIDVSLSGAAVAVAVPPPIGTSVAIGRTPGRVVRHLQGGVGIEFLLPLSPDRFDDGIVL
jgi:hypothetical protein